MRLSWCGLRKRSGKSQTRPKPERSRRGKGYNCHGYDENVTDYEVEFLDEAGNHLDLLTVNAVDLELVT
jgi:hypothetical protein